MKNTTAYILSALLLLLSLPTAAQEEQPQEMQETQEAQEAQEAQEKIAFVPSADTDPDHLWEQANEAYMLGDFAAAAEMYESILSQGLFSAKLYYNLANAYFRTGENARAILYYNRALRLAPNDDDIRYNLAIAENLAKDKIDEVPEFFLKAWMRRVRNSLDENAWTLLSILFFAAALALGLLFLLARRTPLRKAGFYGTLITALLFIVAVSFAAAQRRTMLDRREAIVMSTAAPVKSSPDRSATDLFVLHEGTKVRITGVVDRWCEVVIADGKKGWIESDKIERI